MLATPKVTQPSFCFDISDHARMRMEQRGVSFSALNAALQFGRLICTRGADIYVIGRKEIDHYRQEGIDLDAYQGVQIVCSHDGTVMTAYRNKKFRSLRPHCRSYH